MLRGVDTSTIHARLNAALRPLASPVDAVQGMRPFFLCPQSEPIWNHVTAHPTAVHLALHRDQR